MPGSAQAPAGAGSHVELRNVSLRFGGRRVFDGLDCRIPRGEISVILGGSGTGKSTLLRLVGGLQQPDAGEVWVAGEAIQDLSERQLGPVRCRLGMLFQNGALLDSLSVFENVALPLRERSRRSEAEIAEAVNRRLREVGLSDVNDLLPGALSGGMLRRVALARAIIMDPEILLVDEPFSGLDPPNVARIEALLVRLNRELGFTVLITSHHMASAMRMGHQLVLLREGRALCGSPAEFAASPDPSITEFLGADALALAVSSLGAEASG